MEFTLSSNTFPVRINNIKSIRTPRLVVLEELVNYNLQTMRKLLGQYGGEDELSILCPHIKTAKSSWAVQKMTAAGIKAFKCSLNEVDLLINAGVKEIFVSYPLLPADALWLAQKIDKNPQITFYIQLGHPKHVEFALHAKKEMRIKWNYFIDINVGMGRTGIEAEEALDFYQRISEQEGLHFTGLHAYDGHIHDKLPEERLESSRRAMERLKGATHRFVDGGVAIEKNVVAGTPSFVHDLENLSSDSGYTTPTLYSPGTWIYFDTNYQAMMPGTFEPAAFILAQIMDKPSNGLATLNLGHKRWAVDQGPVEAFSIPGMRAQSWSEEHTVVSVPRDHKVEIGDYVLIAPRHVCSTVNLWEYFIVIDKDGEIKDAQCPIEGRNR